MWAAGDLGIAVSPLNSTGTRCWADRPCCLRGAARAVSWGCPSDPCFLFQMERMRMDPSSVITVKEKLHIPKMRTFPVSPVAPIHRKAKLLTRCPLRGEVAAEVANFLALVMVEDEMR